MGRNFSQNLSITSLPLLNSKATFNSCRKIQNLSHFLPTCPKFSTKNDQIKRNPNELLKFLNQKILSTGPIPVPIFTNICLHHPTLGYYSSKNKDKDGDPFGSKGDFITSPEISQVFGELIAIWMISRWQAAGSPQKLRLIELGPGRGTLLADLIRTFQSLKSFSGKLDSIHLIEKSQFMQDLQKQRLDKLGWKGEAFWYNEINDVPEDQNSWTMVVAHEFFDALPVHIFQKTERGFREVMVDVQDPDLSLKASNSSNPLRFVISPGPTLASQTLINENHKRLSNCSKLEVSPSSVQVATQISKLIKSSSSSKFGGVGLVIDYGDCHSFGNSFRGFYNHQIVDPLSNPGLTDITSNVDFSELIKAMEPYVTTYGPITQSDFLLSMGIEIRSKNLSKDAEASAERLISKVGMGTQYKFLGFESSPSGTTSDEVYPFPSSHKAKN